MVSIDREGTRGDRLGKDTQGCDQENRSSVAPSTSSLGKLGVSFGRTQRFKGPSTLLHSANAAFDSLMHGIRIVRDPVPTNQRP